MNRFLNIVTGWVALACVLVLGRTGAALTDSGSNRAIVSGDYIFLGLVVGSIFFLQYALERYLVPPGLFTKQQRARILEGSWAFYKRGAIGISYFFLVLYAVTYLMRPTPAHLVNWMMPAVFFLILGMAGTARAIILHLANQNAPAERVHQPRP